MRGLLLLNPEKLVLFHLSENFHRFFHTNEKRSKTPFLVHTFCISFYIISHRVNTFSYERFNHKLSQGNACLRCQVLLLFLSDNTLLQTSLTSKAISAPVTETRKLPYLQNYRQTLMSQLKSYRTGFPSVTTDVLQKIRFPLRSSRGNHFTKPKNYQFVLLCHDVCM